MNIKQLKEKTTKQLQKLKVELQKEQFNLRMQRGSNNEKSLKPHLFKKARRDVARIETLLTQKINNNL